MDGEVFGTGFRVSTIRKTLALAACESILLLVLFPGLIALKYYLLPFLDYTVVFIPTYLALLCGLKVPHRIGRLLVGLFLLAPIIVLLGIKLGNPVIAHLALVPVFSTILGLVYNLVLISSLQLHLEIALSIAGVSRLPFAETGDFVIFWCYVLVACIIPMSGLALCATVRLFNRLTHATLVLWMSLIFLGVFSDFYVPIPAPVFFSLFGVIGLAFFWVFFEMYLNWRRINTLPIYGRGGGLEADELLHLPRETVASEDDLKALPQPFCSICQDDIAVAQEVTVLPACRHCFHTLCVQVWLRQKAVCPNCNCRVWVEDFIEAATARRERSSTTATNPAALARAAESPALPAPPPNCPAPPPTGSTEAPHSVDALEGQEETPDLEAPAGHDHPHDAPALSAMRRASHSLTRQSSTGSHSVQQGGGGGGVLDSPFLRSFVEANHRVSRIAAVTPSDGNLVAPLLPNADAPVAPGALPPHSGSFTRSRTRNPTLPRSSRRGSVQSAGQPDAPPLPADASSSSAASASASGRVGTDRGTYRPPTLPLPASDGPARSAESPRSAAGRAAMARAAMAQAAAVNSRSPASPARALEHHAAADSHEAPQPVSPTRRQGRAEEGGLADRFTAAGAQQTVAAGVEAGKERLADEQRAKGKV